MLALAALLLPFIGRQCGDRQRMDFVSDQTAERFINQLVPSQRPLALKFGGNNERAEMRIVVAAHVHGGIAESGFD